MKLTRIMVNCLSNIITIKNAKKLLPLKKAIKHQKLPTNK